MRHGRAGYTSGGCRCDTCREAEAKYQRAHRAAKRGLQARIPCWFCSEHFTTDHGRAVHAGLTHERGK